MTPSATSRLVGQRSRIAWQPYAAIGAVLAAVAWEIQGGWQMSWPLQVAALLILALIEAALIGNRWRRLCGPVLFYDMVRTARQGRYALIRMVYGIILFAALSLLARSWLNRPANYAKDLASFANSFFTTMVMIQFTVIIAMTPAYTAGSITEEKERKTLEYLLATDLSSREIILGKFFSRLGNLTLLLMTGFPIVALLQLLGGIDPDLLLMTLAATLLLMMSLAAASVLCSVYAPRTRKAVVATYAGLFVYLILLPLFYGLLRVPSRWIPVTGPRAEFLDVFDFINSGNPFYAFGRITGAPGRSLIDELADSLARFALIHIVVTVACLGWAILRLRGVFLKENTHSRTRLVAVRKTRVIGSSPIVWKEMQTGTRSIVTRALFAAMILLTFAPAFFIFGEVNQISDPDWREHLANSFNFYLRSVGTLVICGLLLSILLKASGTVTIEREKQTLDTLLTTPLSTMEVLHGKWLGSILAFGRGALLWLGALWMLGLATGGLSAAGLVMSMLVLAVFTTVCSSIGLWASTIARSSVRAHMTALGTVALLALGHWIVSPVFALSNAAEGYVKFAAVSLTPPVTIVFAAFSEPEMTHGLGSDGAAWVGLAFVGLFIWSGVGALFYRLAYSSFRERGLEHVLVIDPRTRGAGLNDRPEPTPDGAIITSGGAQETERPGDVDRHVR
jgi:ABC-type transport system involved in multi-copper enzyme maturation permease subunit